MNLSEQIAALLNTRGLKVAGLQELQQKAEDEGRVFNAEEQGAFDGIAKECDDIDAHIERLKTTEAIVARTARPVIEVREHKPQLAKGIGFARYVQLIAASQGNDLIAMEMAKQYFPQMPEMLQLFKARSIGLLRAAVPAATTSDPAWAGTLVYASQLSGELIELVRAEAILGRLTALREVPFNVRIPRETSVIGTAAWVGQGASKPVGKGAYDFVTMPFTKAALIVALTEELARFSNPSAENLMRDGLVQAVTEFLDAAFISAAAAVAGVSPAGIRAALPPGQTFPSSGDTLQHMQYDIGHAVSLLAPTAPRSPAWIMNPVNGIVMGQQLNPFGQPAYPSVNGVGGTLAGYPVVTSRSMPVDVILLIDQNMILHASDGSVTVDVSREASIQLDGAPATPPTALVSLWQQNMIGLRAEKFEHWLRARDTSVVEITGVSYSTAAPPALMAAPAGAAGARTSKPTQQ